MLKHISLFAACLLAFTGTVVEADAQQRTSVEESENVSVVLRCSYASPDSAKNTEALFYKDKKQTVLKKRLLFVNNCCYIIMISPYLYIYCGIIISS